MGGGASGKRNSCAHRVVHCKDEGKKWDKIYNGKSYYFLQRKDCREDEEEIKVGLSTNKEVEGEENIHTKRRGWEIENAFQESESHLIVHK